MLKIVVCVSGGGTNLQAIIDGIADGTITNTEIVGVISNNKNAYALERAKKAGIFAECISPKDYETREIFNDALLDGVLSLKPDLIVLAGKGHETYQEIHGVKYPLDEREVVAEILAGTRE